MTMPHSRRPRRNRVAKKRARLGLPPLVDEPNMIAESTPPIGVTSIMIPLATPVREMLSRVRREQQRRDPKTVASDQLYAAAILTVALAQVHDALFPSLIAAPTAANMAKAQQIAQAVR